VVAERMNTASKLVFSRTMRASPWANTEVVSSDPVAELRRRKAEPGPDRVILGSGTLIGPLTQERLIDEYQVVVVPIALGEGRPMFTGLDVRSNLRMMRVRSFANGAVVIWYEPA
jgi:dihydrofolate reductase